MHLSSARKASLVCVAMSLHGSLPLRVVALVPSSPTPPSPTRRGFLQTATVAATGTLLMGDAMLVKPPTAIADDESVASSSRTISTSSSFSSDRNPQDGDQKAKQEEKARKAAEKEAQRLAEETKKRLAVGRIGTN